MSDFFDLLNKQMDTFTDMDGPSGAYDVRPAATLANTPAAAATPATPAAAAGPDIASKIVSGIGKALGAGAETLATSGTNQSRQNNLNAELGNKAIQDQVAAAQAKAAMGGGVIATPAQATQITAPMMSQPTPSVQLAPTAGVPSYNQFQLGQQPQFVYSDENLKTNIQSTDPTDIDQFLKTLQPKDFEYIDPKYGTKTMAGLTTQDLQKSKIGKQVVKQTAAGAVVDTAKLAPILATIMSYKTQQFENKLNDALAKLTKKGKK